MRLPRREWLWLCVALALLGLGGCVQAERGDGVSRIVSPTMTDSEVGGHADSDRGSYLQYLP